MRKIAKVCVEITSLDAQGMPCDLVRQFVVTRKRNSERLQVLQSCNMQDNESILATDICDRIDLHFDVTCVESFAQ